MDTAWADVSVMSVHELGELTRKRDRAASEQWLDLCRRFLTDPETNAAAPEARDWFAHFGEAADEDSSKLTPEEELRSWFSAGLPFRLAAPFRVDPPRKSAEKPYPFLRTLLYPAACEWVSRDVDRGLAEFITRDLEGERHVNLSSPEDERSSAMPRAKSRSHGTPEDKPSSEGDLETLEACALDDRTFDSISTGIFTAPALLDAFEQGLDPMERLTSGSGPYISAVKSFDSAVSNLVATGRLGSAKHQKALSRLRRQFRHLAAEAFHRPEDCAETGSILFYAACRALGWADGESVDDFRAPAGALAGKVTELAGFTRTRAHQTNKKRQERILRNVDRHTVKFDVRLAAEVERLGIGDRKFATHQAAMDHIAQTLEWAVPTPVAISIAGEFVVYCEGDPAELDDWPSGPGGSAETRIDGPFGFDWTVREQDLRDLKEVAALVCAVYLGMDKLTSLILAATCMLWRLKRKGVAINPLQRAVLIALRRSGPLTIPALTAEAAMFRVGWTQKDVEDTLTELKAVRLDDGTVTALVHEASDGLWSTDAHGLWEVPFATFG